VTNSKAVGRPNGSEDAIGLLKRRFDGAVVLVVGGAGGIGSEVVRQAADLGARVVVASRNGAPLGAVGGAKMISARLDLTDPRSIAAFADWMRSEFPRLDVLVNTAGVTRQVVLRDLDKLDDDTIDLVFASNATGVLRLLRDLLSSLREAPDPCIVNVSSVAARTGVGSNVADVGAKAALDAMSVALAKALAPEIRVVSVTPSALETDFVTGRSRDFIDRTIIATPLGRLATTKEVANAVLCAAGILTMTTGSAIYVDGGRHL